jgi:hypothetical protein
MEPRRGHSTLILGAGASAAYGFPTGPAFKDRILATHSVRQTLDAPSHTLVHAFVRDLLNSEFGTIDRFLQANHDFKEIGKVAIAAALIPLERDAALTCHNPRDDWYRLLFDALCQMASSG